ncbi:MAG: septum formation initiator family protein [Erysipelotrichia bacterium]|nr:septum formation initiator family protein [Erysipelotrichia bacterium]
MTPFLKFICFVMIAFSIGLLVEVGREVYTTIELKKQLTISQAKYQEVQDESAYLSSEKDKLQDPDYVQSYARGNYMLSKDGEQIFYLPENTNK